MRSCLVSYDPPSASVAFAIAPSSVVRAAMYRATPQELLLPPFNGGDDGDLCAVRQCQRLLDHPNLLCVFIENDTEYAGSDQLPRFESADGCSAGTVRVYSPAP